jgi:VanZ family protein
MRDEVHRLRWLRLWLGTGWLLVGAVVYLSLTPAPPELDLPDGDKLGHVLAYSVLMFWFVQIYHRRRARVWFAVGFVLLGIASEFLQGYGGQRQFEIQDMVANSIGVALGWLSGPPRTSNLLLRIESLLLS